METLKPESGKQFLKKIKSTINDGDFALCNDEKNQRMFIKLGFKSPVVNQVKTAILSLNESHYHSGPEKDNNGKGAEVFIFRYAIDGEVIFIRLSCKVGNDKKLKTKCMSFNAWGEV